MQIHGNSRVFSYLKIYMRHWVLSSLGSMWIEHHTKFATMYSNDIDVFALLSSAVIHCYICDDSNSTRWKVEKQTTSGLELVGMKWKIHLDSLSNVKFQYGLFRVMFQHYKLNARSVCLGSTFPKSFSIVSPRILGTKHFRWLILLPGILRIDAARYLDFKSECLL